MCYRGPSRDDRGFVLPTVLLLVLLISSVSIGLYLTVNTESRLAGTDLQSTRSYYAAEAAMEKMIVDINRLFTQNLAPSVAQIQDLSANPPALDGITFSEYEIDVEDNGSGFPAITPRTITGGPYEGMSAQILPLTLTATAQAPLGTEARMSRDVHVTLIPVFQFGIFSEGDLSYFPGPNFNFGGRVHTNGNLFLATSAELKFNSKITSAGHIVRAELSNGLSTIDTGRTGPVKVPTAPGGCDGAEPACRDLDEGEGSVTGGPSSATNPAWANLSTSVYNGMILNSETGARPLELPFVREGSGKSIDLIRQPTPGEDGSSLLSQSRYYNRSQIRVLLADDPAELPDTGVRLINGPPYIVPGFQLICHKPGTPAEHTKALHVNSVAAHLGHGDTLGPCPGGPGLPPIDGPTPFAESDLLDGDFVVPPGTLGGDNWGLIDGWLLVQARQGSGWTNVTGEWLGLGIAREDPNAILRFQTVKGPSVTDLSNPLNFLPLNLYDTREGEVRDVSLGENNASCAVGGIMNVVELDVGNLKAWLGGGLGTTGSLTDSVSENGYVLYFSDRRGMVAGPSGKTGEYGYEDIINPALSTGDPDAQMAGAEDVNDNGALDTYGASNLGESFGVANGNPTLRVDCATVGKKNRVRAARHGLKLVNGGLGSLPTRPDGTGGFTVTSENPVYVQGDYNADAGGFGDPHAAAAIIADAVTLLSNSWNDWNSFDDSTYVGSATDRLASETWYRVAIAAGKNKSWPHPSWTTAQDYGLDGGTHNFLRYLENWSGQTLHYKGSLVSLYYSGYGVGIYKCCQTVYTPPVRDYTFDTEFAYPEKLPPGTPHFRDVVNLHFRQLLAVP